jgi:ribokinase
MVAVIGSLNIDVVAFVERIPKVGETLTGKRFRESFGGKGANQAVAIAKLGVPINMVGCIGYDDRGLALLNSLENNGVNVKYVTRISDVPTGVALIQVDSCGNNTIVVIPAANDMLSIELVKKSIRAIEDSNVVVAQMEVPVETVKYVFEVAKSFGKTTILNPAPADMFDDSIISNTDVLVPNEVELETISGISIKRDDDVLSAARILLNKGVRDLIVTLGERGCIHFSGNNSKKYNGKKVIAVDTTAAGDSFVGTLAAMLSEGNRIDKAIEYAITASALSVTKEGAQISLPYRAEVENFAGKISEG